MANEKRLDLIDRNELKEKLQEHHDFFVDGVGGFSYLTPKDKARVDEITHCIAETVNAPTVDAVVLPCKIGDDVYIIPSKTNFKLNVLAGLEKTIGFTVKR